MRDMRFNSSSPLCSHSDTLHQTSSQLIRYKKRMRTRTPLLILSFTLGLVFGAMSALISMTDELSITNGVIHSLLTWLPGLFTLSLLVALGTLLLARGLTLVFAEDK